MLKTEEKTINYEKTEMIPERVERLPVLKENLTDSLTLQDTSQNHPTTAP